MNVTAEDRKHDGRVSRSTRHTRSFVESAGKSRILNLDRKIELADRRAVDVGSAGGVGANHARLVRVEIPLSSGAHGDGESQTQGRATQ